MDELELLLYVKAGSGELIPPREVHELILDVKRFLNNKGFHAKTKEGKGFITCPIEGRNQTFNKVIENGNQA